MEISELCISTVLIAIIILALYYTFKENVDRECRKDTLYSIDYLCQETKNHINEIINMDMSILKLNQRDLKNRKALKRELSQAVRHCAQGNITAKMNVFFRIKANLAGKLDINEENIDATIPFQDPIKLTPTDKFEILMYLQKRAGGRKMFWGICEKAGLDRLKQDERGYYYDVTEEDIQQAFDQLSEPLSYDDKLNILTQRVYQELYGLSVADLMIMEDESIDSVSGGVSGITKENYRFFEDDIFQGDIKKPRTHESIWIVYAGKPIHLKFLSFYTKSTIIRICRNLAESRKSGHFTSSAGGLKTNLADGSRATIFRPNNGSQWAFWVRKFGSASTNELKNLIIDRGNKYPISIIRWAVKGCLNLIFSGDQNSGKTTNVRAAIREIDRRQTIRTIEADFELYLNDAYEGMNIFGTVPSKLMSFTKLIELLKSAEAHTILFGETASLEHAKHLIDLLLAGTKRIITTGHWPTTDELISYFVHSMGAYGSGGPQEVEALVARLLHIDIHCVKNNEGHRYIDRITEIIPLPVNSEAPASGEGIEGKLENIAHYLKQMARRKTYVTRDIVIYENGEYKRINPISERLSAMILKNLPPEEREAFLEFNQIPEGGVKEAC